METKENMSIDDMVGIDLLRQTYRDITGFTAPRTLKCKMLANLIAWHIECIKNGLPANDEFFYRQKAIRDLSFASDDGLGRSVVFREWSGRMHIVRQRKDGRFVYDKRTFTSLTRVAKEITGTHRSGPAFFGA